MQRIASFVVLTLVALIVSITSVSAQDLPPGNPLNNQFRAHFQAVMDANRDVTDFTSMQPGREYNLPDGMRDKLETGDARGIWGREFRKIYGASYESVIAEAKVETAKPEDKPPVDPPPPPPPAVDEAGFNWMWLLLIPLALGALYLMLRHLPEPRRPNLPFLGRWNPTLTTHPITAAPPMTPGGIAPDNHQAIRQQFREQAARTYADAHGGIMPSMETIRIVSDPIPGTLHDVWETRDGNGRWIPRRYNGEPGFQGMVSINNGEPMLQTWSLVCGNDLRSGRRYRGGRFVPDTAAQPIPATEPATAPTPFRPHIAAETSDGPVTTLTIGNARYGLPAESDIQIGQGGQIRIRANGVITITEMPKSKKLRAVRSATATGTGD